MTKIPMVSGTEGTIHEILVEDIISMGSITSFEGMSINELAPYVVFQIFFTG